MPFLRLTRDRRGFENTFLLHASQPGEKPRVLYWYRTAPGVALGRPPLDEEAIRTIEDQHPDIDFDWPAILALSEVMTPEDEEAPRPPKPQRQKAASSRRDARELRRDDRAEERAVERETESVVEPPVEREITESPVEERKVPEPTQVAANPLLGELVGREIAARLRARHAEVVARIHDQNADSSVREAWLKRADAINPDLWTTPEAILEGVRNADSLFDQLRAELTS